MTLAPAKVTPLRRRRPAALQLTPQQAAALVPLATERLTILRELHAVQVEHLPPGSDAWAETAEQLDTLHGAVIALQNWGRQ